MTKEEAQAAYDAAKERHEAAQADLVEKRRNLDEVLRDEEAANRAVFMGFDPGDEEARRVVRRMADQKREAKTEAHASVDASSLGDEAVGGVS